MANLKFLILLVLAAAAFEFPCGVEALTCFCTVPVPDCINLRQKCDNFTTECVRVEGKIGNDPSYIDFIERCNFVPPNDYELPPEGNDGFCRYEYEPTSTFTYSYCFCNTDLCTQPSPNYPPIDSTALPAGNAKGTGIVLRSWTWIPLAIFASSAIIVSAFVGGQ